MNLVCYDDVESIVICINLIKDKDGRPHWDCGCLSHSCRPRTRVLASRSKMSVQPHEALQWITSQLTNLPSLSMSHVVRISI